LGLLCSKLSFEFLKIQNPTLNFQVGNIKNIPVIIEQDSSVRSEIDRIVDENIKIFKEDWDNFETSWDFKKFLLMKYKDKKWTFEK
jgi:hypothetical protein